LDIAASCGYIDCARWLWLNQWSVSLPKKEDEEEISSEKPAKPPSSFTSPSKPLQECSTLFTKPEVPPIPSTDAVKPKVPPITKSSILRESLNIPTTDERPLSSPLFWRLNKLENRVSFPKNNKFQTYAETKRPFTAVAKRGEDASSPKSPRLLPQLSANIYRGRSIPSVQETRYQKPSAAQLRVDIQTRSFVKPVSIHMPLTGKVI